LLVKQKIKGNENVKKDELITLYQQDKNRRLPIIPFSPYVWFYQVGLKNYDKEKIEDKKDQITLKFDQKIGATQKEKKIARLNRRKNKKLSKKDKALLEGNVLMRWGEPLAIYDPTLTQRTRELMEQYVHSKGYFNARVTNKEKPFLKRMKVSYFIEEGEPHQIDTVLYTSGDPKVIELIQASSSKSKLVVGENYDQRQLEQERERIDNLLKDHGFYDFSRQYINMNVDTAWRPLKVAIETVVSEPNNRDFHKVFKVDSVLITTDADIKNMSYERLYSTYNRVTYRFYEEEYSKKVLNRRLFVFPDSVYSKSNTFQTQRQFANLDIYKFININYDTTGGKFIANVFLSPLKKYQTTAEVGLTVSQGLPGPFANASFKNRNVFGGLEIMQLSVGGSIEGVPPATVDERGLNSREAYANIGFTFPQFLLPWERKLKRRFQYFNPKTLINPGIVLTDRPEYDRTNANLQIGYNWQSKKNNRYNLNLVDLAVINSTI